MELAGVYHNAMLASLASSQRIGFWSGLAYTLGYLGGVTLFLIWLLLPKTGLLPADDGSNLHERLVGPICAIWLCIFTIFFFQAEDGIRDLYVTGVQTCALPI